MRVQRGSSGFPHFALKGAARLSFTARIEGAHSDRAASASKKDGLAVPLPPFQARSFSFLKGWPGLVTNCARRTTTALSWGFREQRGLTWPPFSSLIGDHPRPLQPAYTVLPKFGRVLVKDADRIRRQSRPSPLEHFEFQLPRSPPGESRESPEGFGRFRLRNDAFQDLRCAPHIDPVEDRSCVCWRLLEPEQQKKVGWLDRPTSKQPIAGPLEHGEVRQRLGQENVCGAIQNEPKCSLRPVLHD